jgi:hypothetical protein
MEFLVLDDRRHTVLLRPDALPSSSRAHSALAGRSLLWLSDTRLSVSQPTYYQLSGSPAAFDSFDESADRAFDGACHPRNTKRMTKTPRTLWQPCRGLELDAPGSPAPPLHLRQLPIIAHQDLQGTGEEGQQSAGARHRPRPTTAVQTTLGLGSFGIHRLCNFEAERRPANRKATLPSSAGQLADAYWPGISNLPLKD